MLNCPYGPDEVWDELPRKVQEQIVDMKLRFFVVDASGVAMGLGLGPRINTILQTCFFHLSNVMPPDEAIAQIKHFIEKTYGAKGNAVVKLNFAAVDAALAALHEVTVFDKVAGTLEIPPIVPVNAPEFVRKVSGEIMAGRGDAIPVSWMPADGTFPGGTTQFEKRNIAVEVPIWEPDLCLQCGQCSIVCPHSVIRAKTYPTEALTGAPAGFKSAPVNAIRGWCGIRSRFPTGGGQADGAGTGSIEQARSQSR